MGRWAQRQKRGGGGSQSVTSFPVVLTFVGPDGFSWTYSGPDPDSWSIQASVLVGGPFVEADNIPGNNRSDAGFAPTGFYRVVGEDPGGNPITDYSNVVVY